MYAIKLSERVGNLGKALLTIPIKTVVPYHKMSSEHLTTTTASAVLTDTAQTSDS